VNGPITSTNRPDDERAERRRRREQAEAATRAEWAAHPGVKDKYEAPLTCPSCGHGFTAALRDEQDALDDALAAIRHCRSPDTDSRLRQAKIRAFGGRAGVIGQTCIGTPILDTLHLPVTDPSRRVTAHLL